MLIGASVEKVETGSRLVGDAGVTMDNIVAQVKRVADLIAEISAATIEQTTGIGQVSEAGRNFTRPRNGTPRSSKKVRRPPTA